MRNITNSQGLRAWSAALLVACIALVLGACSRGARVGELETVDAPFLEKKTLEFAAAGVVEACTWQADGALHVRSARTHNGNRYVTNLWIDFEPEGAPRVRVSHDFEPGGKPSDAGRHRGKILSGRAWVSGDGTGLGEPGGPGLELEAWFQMDIHFTEEAEAVHLYLEADQLLRGR